MALTIYKNLLSHSSIEADEIQVRVNELHKKYKNASPTNRPIEEPIS